MAVNNNNDDNDNNNNGMNAARQRLRAVARGNRASSRSSGSGVRTIRVGSSKGKEWTPRQHRSWGGVLGLGGLGVRTTTARMGTTARTAVRQQLQRGIDRSVGRGINAIGRGVSRGVSRGVNAIGRGIGRTPTVYPINNSQGNIANASNAANASRNSMQRLAAEITQTLLEGGTPTANGNVQQAAAATLGLAGPAAGPAAMPPTRPSANSFTVSSNNNKKKNNNGEVFFNAVNTLNTNTRATLPKGGANNLITAEVLNRNKMKKGIGNNWASLQATGFAAWLLPDGKSTNPKFVARLVWKHLVGDFSAVYPSMNVLRNKFVVTAEFKKLAKMYIDAIAPEKLVRGEWTQDFGCMVYVQGQKPGPRDCTFDAVTKRLLESHELVKQYSRNSERYGGAEAVREKLTAQLRRQTVEAHLKMASRVPTAKNIELSRNGANTNTVKSLVPAKHLAGLIDGSEEANLLDLRAIANTPLLYDYVIAVYRQTDPSTYERVHIPEFDEHNKEAGKLQPDMRHRPDVALRYNYPPVEMVDFDQRRKSHAMKPLYLLSNRNKIVGFLRQTDQNGKNATKDVEVPTALLTSLTDSVQARPASPR